MPETTTEKENNTTVGITRQEFNSRLRAKCEARGGTFVLSLPGVYEIASEHFNNEILEDWENEVIDTEKLIAFRCKVCSTRHILTFERWGNHAKFVCKQCNSAMYVLHWVKGEASYLPMNQHPEDAHADAPAPGVGIPDGIHLPAELDNLLIKSFPRRR